jgi:hypothetical protein
MSEFVYLYRSPPSPPVSPQQMQERMQRWTAWFKDVEARGHLASLGHPLDHKGGGVVKDKQGAVNDGPFTETKDIIIGFSIIRAKDFEEAVRLTNDHPIFDQGGVIEVRPIMKM